MHRGAHINFKHSEIFPMLPYVNENFERESNLMPHPIYLYLSRSAFLVSFTDPNEKLFNIICL